MIYGVCTIVDTVCGVLRVGLALERLINGCPQGSCLEFKYRSVTYIHPEEY
jgi:hypothetical protein